jgi:CheY-like chemotaxis protein
MLAHFLRRAGYKVDVAATTAEAITFIDTVPYALVISDNRFKFGIIALFGPRQIFRSDGHCTRDYSRGEPKWLVLAATGLRAFVSSPEASSVAITVLAPCR